MNDVLPGYSLTMIDIVLKPYVVEAEKQDIITLFEDIVILSYGAIFD